MPGSVPFLLTLYAIFGVMATIIGWRRGGEAFTDVEGDQILALTLVMADPLGEHLGLWQSSTLDQHRTLLQYAIETRFGPMSETALQRLQTWEKSQLQELGSKVPEAKTSKELGLEE